MVLQRRGYIPRKRWPSTFNVRDVSSALLAQGVDPSIALGIANALSPLFAKMTQDELANYLAIERSLGGRPPASYVIASSTAPDIDKANADLVLTGVNDATAINAFLDTNPLGGRSLSLTAGLFTLNDDVILSGDHWRFFGQGPGTILSFASGKQLYIFAGDGSIQDAHLHDFRILNGEGMFADPGSTTIVTLDHVYWEASEFGVRNLMGIMESCVLRDITAQAVDGTMKVVANNYMTNVWRGVETLGGQLVIGNYIRATDRAILLSGDHDTIVGNDAQGTVADIDTGTGTNYVARGNHTSTGEWPPISAAPTSPDTAVSTLFTPALIGVYPAVDPTLDVATLDTFARNPPPQSSLVPASTDDLATLVAFAPPPMLQSAPVDDPHPMDVFDRNPPPVASSTPIPDDLSTLYWMSLES